MIRYIKSDKFVAAALGELVGPMAKTEDKAVSLLTEYLLGDAGRNRFYELHPDTTESEYYEALYQLYDMEITAETQREDSREDLEASFSGASNTSCEVCDASLALS